MIDKFGFYDRAYSDFLVNNQRWILAEYIVAKVLNITEQKRIEWDAYDLKYWNLKIEIKSCSYIQSWEQKKSSKIIFNISPTHKFNYSNNSYDSKYKRQSDAYVFCLLNHKDKSTVNPLDINQWLFFIVETKILDNKLNDQKTIWLSTLAKLWIEPVVYTEIKSNIDKLIDK